MKYIVTLNNKNYEVEVNETEAVLLSTTDAVPSAPAPVSVPVAASPAPQAAPVGDGEIVKSPMPGTILNIKASAGTVVKKGQPVIVLEAMKMENDIPAPVDGTVKQILVSQGATVETDTPLFVIG